jgi:uncharacterized protein (UPF0212 family)
MRVLSASELLNAWERAAPLSTPDRAVVLLGVYASEGPREIAAPEHLSIGRRNLRLLALRESMFGDEFAAVASCPACAGRVEASFTAAEIRTPDVEAPVVPTCEATGCVVSFRLPDSRDLESITHVTTVEDARLDLLERIVSSAVRDGVAVETRSLDAEVVAAIGREIERLDPNADIRLSFACPYCGATFDTGFDVAAFLWDELDAWAARMLGEVHQLASAYGWSERDILEMSACRRQAYLDLLTR